MAIKVGAAATVGLALGADYVKPEVISAMVEQNLTPSAPVVTPTPPPDYGQPSIDLEKTISEMNWTTGIVSGAVTITNRSSDNRVSVLVVGYSDTVEQRKGSQVIHTVTYTNSGISGISAGNTTIPGPAGTSGTYTYSVSAGSIDPRTTSVRNTVSVFVQHRDKVYHSTDSVERSVSNVRTE